eukprot:TRINITY_DN2989_c0_g1_i1.p1 TRINITY_DN2989_c0_g1~~TRINITY_DN2989_c0_g1_i1.p1  ORF type:complete len:732 (+),score=133.23 TRINITY_DN2989_c0_g1_i1:1283-3478(+)
MLKGLSQPGLLFRNSINTLPHFSKSATYCSPITWKRYSSTSKEFRLTDNFIEKYKNKEPKFGFGALSELVFLRTYSRLTKEGENEAWYQTVERVVNGTYNMQKRWIDDHGLEWVGNKAQASAQNMYTRIFEMKFLPPGRGLWAMGTPIIEEKNLYASLNNCAFVSTENIKGDLAKPFTFLMDASMLGVGVGFDTKGAGTVLVKGANLDKVNKHLIGDSREGWVESVKVLIEACVFGQPIPQFDYSQIRPAGTPMKAFGGIASGPENLKILHEEIKNVLMKNKGELLTATTIVDVMNFIGKSVVSGGTRATAEIAFGECDSNEFLDLKNYEVNPHRGSYGWTSNNSIFANLGMNYGPICERIRNNGEPGFAWLENMRSYSRMNENEKDNKDHRAKGGNPCLEQTLESYEMCCLVETFPHNHTSLEDYKTTLKFAYLYAKTVTLGQTHWPETNKVTLRNRRIGCSMSGLAQFITTRGIDELKKWSTEGYQTIKKYDEKFSDWFAVPRSIKTTSIKPSGTVSLLAGATPGMHYPISQYYIRRVRVNRLSPLIEPLKNAGIHIEPSLDNPNDMVVSMPIAQCHGMRKERDVSMWEQLSLAAFLQKYWADNQVSCTISFDPVKEGPQIEHALNYFQYQLKGVSFLPRDSKKYPQMPYEEIDEETYNKMVSQISPVKWNQISPHKWEFLNDPEVKPKMQHQMRLPDAENFCGNEACALPPHANSGEKSALNNGEKTE